MEAIGVVIIHQFNRVMKTKQPVFKHTFSRSGKVKYLNVWHHWRKVSQLLDYVTKNATLFNF